MSPFFDQKVFIRIPLVFPSFWGANDSRGGPSLLCKWSSPKQLKVLFCNSCYFITFCLTLKGSGSQRCLCSLEVWIMSDHLQEIQLVEIHNLSSKQLLLLPWTALIGEEEQAKPSLYSYSTQSLKTFSTKKFFRSMMILSFCVRWGRTPGALIHGKVTRRDSIQAQPQGEASQPPSQNSPAPATAAGTSNSDATTDLPFVFIATFKIQSNSDIPESSVALKIFTLSKHLYYRIIEGFM